MKKKNLKENSISLNEHGSLNEPQNNSNYGDMSKNELTFERTKIEGTPFTKVWSKEHGYSAGIAEYRATPWYETEEDLLKKLSGTEIGTLDWDLLTGVISILIDKTLELNKIEEEVTKRMEEEK